VLQSDKRSEPPQGGGSVLVRCRHGQSRSAAVAAAWLAAGRAGPRAAGPPALQGLPRAGSHCRFVLPLIHLIPDSLRDSGPLFLKRQCDRILGLPSAGTRGGQRVPLCVGAFPGHRRSVVRERAGEVRKEHCVCMFTSTWLQRSLSSHRGSPSPVEFGCSLRGRPPWVGRGGEYRKRARTAFRGVRRIIIGAGRVW
jgi:hypothetical protein